ncbi:TPA: hypothetical protein ACH3X3_005075 [Trebouxia sp. C0006]
MSLSAAGLITAKSSDLLLDSKHTLDSRVNDSSLPLSTNNLSPYTFTLLIDPSKIRICLRPDGQALVLGAGTYGTVYKARRGSQDVAVKTLNTQVLCPGGSTSHDSRSLQKYTKSSPTLQQELQYRSLSQNRNLVQFWATVYSRAASSWCWS